MRDCLGPDPDPRRPTLPIPENTCDTHCHVIGPVARFPFTEPRSYTPPESPFESYMALRRTLGIRRSVIVQPGAHGTDNAVTVDAVERLGGEGRGIVVVKPDVTRDEIAALNERGIRGVRLSTVLAGGLGTDHIATMADRIAPFGWQIVLHLKAADELVALAPVIRALPVDVVIDHMARVTGDEGSASKPFATLLELLAGTDHCWTKICSWYRLSGGGAPYADMRAMAEAVMAARLDRVLWGTNWPHPLLFEPPMPNDGDLMQQFLEWAGSEERRQAVLVDNPARLYGFS